MLVRDTASHPTSGSRVARWSGAGSAVGGWTNGPHLRDAPGGGAAGSILSSKDRRLGSHPAELTAIRKTSRRTGSGCWRHSEAAAGTGLFCRLAPGRLEPFRPDPDPAVRSEFSSGRTPGRVRWAREDQGRRIYLQDIESGTIRAISPENVRTEGLATRDGRFVVGAHEGNHFLYPVDGRRAGAIAGHGARRRGLAVELRRTALVSAQRRVMAARGRSSRYRDGPPRSLEDDSACGPRRVDSIIRILVTPDGKAYCHDYVRFVSQLFIVEGLK